MYTTEIHSPQPKLPTFALDLLKVLAFRDYRSHSVAISARGCGTCCYTLPAHALCINHNNLSLVLISTSSPGFVSYSFFFYVYT